MSKRLLIDVNVPRTAAASLARVIDQKTITWGPVTTRHNVIDYGPAFPDVGRFLRENIPFIPSLAIKGSEMGLEFFTYSLLDFERWNVPPPIDWAGRDICELFHLKEIELNLNSGSVVMDSNPETFRHFLKFLEKQLEEPLLLKLKAKMKQEQSRDCCHFVIAHRFGLDGFVTLDGDFIGPCNQVAKSLDIKLRCYSPKDICRKLRIDEIDESWFAARSDPHIFYEQV